MTQGELEKLALSFGNPFSDLEIRIMDDIVRRIKINGFSTAAADWQMTRLQQLGKSEEDIKEWIRIALNVSEEELERMYSDAVYEQYMGHQRAYKVNGIQQIPFEDNQELQSLIEGIKEQTKGTFENITGSLGFVKQDAAGKVHSVSLSDYYRQTLDSAMWDIHSGAFDYQTVLMRTIEEMTKSGIRWIDYESGHHNRVDVAARRAVMTGFRQVQGKINEQVANDLGTDYYEVTYHIGARPEHQPWQGKVWSMQQLKEVCGLGTVTGLHGANCYHDYNAFIHGVSVRTYDDDQLEQMMERENTPKTYLGKKYTTYEALQRQRYLERTMRKYRQDIKLMQDGGAAEESIMLKKARYHGKMQEYEAFSKVMKLPLKKDRIYQDGLKGVISNTRENPLEDSDWLEQIITRASGGVNKKVKTFYHSLLNIKNDDVYTSLKKSYKRVKFKKSTGRRSHYSKKDNVVYVTEIADGSTIAHELFHEIDIYYGIIDNGALADSVKNDYQKLIEDARQSGKSISDMIYSKYPNIIEQGRKGLKVKSEFRGISDIINGMSSGKINMGYHHDNSYWKKNKALEREVWAQFGRMLYQEDNAIVIARALFPETSREIESLLGRVIS